MINLVKVWVLGSAACVSAGWILSALHQANLAGYAVFFLIFAAALVMEFKRGVLRGAAGCARGGAKSARWIPHRIRRPLPLLFFLTAAAAAVGGALYAPNNYDALTYRFPRMLHWWAASGWHWIDTPNVRMNVSGSAFEWLMMPIFILTHTDRFFFLINIVSYLLMPTLVFAVFVAAGVSGRVAWFWMWLLPAALCFAMQAGSISNDTIATTYFLAAIHFAFQARRSGNIRNLWIAFLAAGLMTGVKAPNLPLLLPLAWVFLPVLGLLARRMITSLAVVLLTILISFAPTAALNQYYTGNWGGDPNNTAQVQVQKPLAGILGNGLQLALQSLEPPFLPLARTAENWVWDRFPEKLQSVLKSGFPRFVVGFRELPQEESAGIGIGITLLCLVSVAAALFFRRGEPGPPTNWVARQGMILGALTWLALLFFMSKLGSESTSRLIAAYYPLLLLPLLLNRQQSLLVRRRWYRGLAILAGVIALCAVVLTPSRPLWPAGRFLDWAAARFPRNVLMKRAQIVYRIYSSRNDLFAGLRKSIPDSVPVIGMIESVDDAESSLWRPFGRRRVVLLTEPDHMAGSKLQWIVVKNNTIELNHPIKFGDWLRQTGGVLVAQQFVTEKAGGGPERWSVVHYPDAPN